MVNFVNGETPLNDTNLNKLQTDLQEEIKNKVYTGQEIATNEYLDNKRVYVQRIDCGALPDANVSTLKSIPIDLDLDLVTIIRVQGIAKNPTSNLIYPLPFVWGSNGLDNVGILISSDNSSSFIQIRTSSDKSGFTQTYLNIYYTKNNE